MERIEHHWDAIEVGIRGAISDFQAPGPKLFEPSPETRVIERVVHPERPPTADHSGVIDLAAQPEGEIIFENATDALHTIETADTTALQEIADLSADAAADIRP